MLPLPPKRCSCSILTSISEPLQSNPYQRHRDTRGFIIPEDDLDEALTGGIGAVLLFAQTATVAIARLSQAGLALHIVIDTRLHTVPMRSLTPVLTRYNRKAPLFVPAEDVAPDAGGVISQSPWTRQIPRHG